MYNNMRNEDKLIIELSKKNKNRAYIDSLVKSNNLNIEYFHKTINQHLIKENILSEIYKYSLPKVIKKELIHKAKGSFIEMTLTNRILKAELAKVFKILNSNKIDSVLMKGLSLDFKGQRYIRDLDMLIHENMLLASIKALKKIDYHYIADKINPLLNFAEKKDIRLQLKWNNQFQLYNKKTNLLLELHTNLFQKSRVYDIDLDSLWHGINSFWKNKVWNKTLRVYTFSIEDQLILMCMQNAIKRSLAANAFTLRTVIDIENLICQKPDWQVFINCAKSYNICPFIYFSLYLTKLLLKTEIPASLLVELKENCTGKQIFIEKIHLRSFQSLLRSSIFFSNLYKILAPFIYQASWKARLRNLFLIHILFPPKWKMAQYFNLQNLSPLIYLTYFINPFRWIFLVSKNLFRKR